MYDGNPMTPEERAAFELAVAAALPDDDASVAKALTEEQVCNILRRTVGSKKAAAVFGVLGAGREFLRNYRLHPSVVHGERDTRGKGRHRH